jgi:hypothetical protein
VIAPPSIVKALFSLLLGSFDRLPTLAQTDILPVIQGKIGLENNLNIPKTPVSISRLAWQLLKGDVLSRYRGRSDKHHAGRNFISYSPLKPFFVSSKLSVFSQTLSFDTFLLR